MPDLMTIFGVWMGVVLTFAIFSFLYKDNPLYKVAEQIFVGLSAGYWFVYTIYFIMIPNLYSKLTEDFTGNALLIIPAILGIMMLIRIIPKFEWPSRYPISLLMGTTAGLSFMLFIKSDLIQQLVATMINPFAADNPAQVFGEILMIVGTVTGLAYFYFSKKHEGVFGVTAKVGIYFLMVSFGAAFGYTVMARVSLLIGRIQFLLGDWLHLINQ
ncbi:MAG: hypothetical protein P9L91_06390 [Candidatus Zophobacter franzmannii]|nr:hypothetical protein [Candidatus Zophobacter franzmannii]